MSLNEKIIELLYLSVIAESGDGDALWLSKHAGLDEIKRLVYDFNLDRNVNWEIHDNNDHLLWDINQEWVKITCNEDVFNSEPSWITLKINL